MSLKIFKHYTDYHAMERGNELIRKLAKDENY